jgi:hypothetical protein
MWKTGAGTETNKYGRVRLDKFRRLAHTAAIYKSKQLRSAFTPSSGFVFFCFFRMASPIQYAKELPRLPKEPKDSPPHVLRRIYSALHPRKRSMPSIRVRSHDVIRHTAIL